MLGHRRRVCACCARVVAQRARAVRPRGDLHVVGASCLLVGRAEGVRDHLIQEVAFARRGRACEELYRVIRWRTSDQALAHGLDVAQHCRINRDARCYTA